VIDAILSFDVDAETPILVEGARHAENAGVMSHQAYGPLVGVPRILDLLAEYKLPATFFIPGLTAERYPDAVEQILAAGHEVGHHSYAHYSPIDQTYDAERRDFERALAALGRFGVEPEGFRCPSWEPTWKTPALVAEFGLAYDSSLMDADTPYVLQTPAGDIVELPVHWALDDWEPSRAHAGLARGGSLPGLNVRVRP
jgi:peptidoglycan-N-acetylglucosamine deacetylase